MRIGVVGDGDGGLVADSRAAADVRLKIGADGAHLQIGAVHGSVPKDPRRVFRCVAVKSKIVPLLKNGTRNTGTIPIQRCSRTRKTRRAGADWRGRFVRTGFQIVGVVAVHSAVRRLEVGVVVPAVPRIARAIVFRPATHPCIV